MVTRRTSGYGYDVAHAKRVLRRNDPQLGELMDRVGPYRLKLRDRKTPFQALLQSIVYQQLSGQAAGAIHRRVLDLFPHRYASPATLLQLNDASLLSAGLSRAKVKAVRDLANRCLQGEVPNARMLRQMNDGEIIQCLLPIRGIGVWTAEMLLIFNLGRPDILPIRDLGVLKGFRITYGLKSNPNPKKMLAHGERWRPYRTMASWYLWRANDL